MPLPPGRGWWIAVVACGCPDVARADDRIAGLVRQLGDASFARREAAATELVAAGEEALPALRTAVAATPNLETRLRSQQVIRRILLAARASKSTKLTTVVIDPGDFNMGSPPREWGRRQDEPQHPVRMTHTFLLGEFEVTQDEYKLVTNAEPSSFAATGPNKARVDGLATGRFPVERVSWFDAVAFCNRLSAKDGYPAYYKLADAIEEGGGIIAGTVTVVGGTGYRLPTEAEWEYACRAGTVAPFHFGLRATGKEANLRAVVSVGYGDSKVVELGRTAKVGSYPPNRWGLYDLHGNVGEWCQDWYDKGYYAKSLAADPPGPAAGLQRVQRGGSWLVSESSCRSAARFWHTPDERKDYAGFRVARTP